MELKIVSSGRGLKRQHHRADAIRTGGRIGGGHPRVHLFGEQDSIHSHPSGDNTGGFLQFPSKTDLDNTGETISYVFGRSNNTTYIFNSSGVLATIPTSRFVDFKRPKK